MWRLEPTTAAAGLVAASALLMLGALGFQYLGDLPPCALCIYQRYPHILVIGLAAVALALGRDPAARPVQIVLLLACATLLAAGGAVAAYHVGVEQKWWAGIPACGGGFRGTGLSIEELRAQLMRTPIVRCDRVPWELGGISLAGFNLLFSALLAAAALHAVRRFAGERRAAA
jgi:disulfide bond formation protein DsbB